MSDAKKNILDEQISQFPKLSDWILSHQKTPPTIENLPELHMWNIAKALRANEPARTKIWTESLQQISQSTAGFMQHVIDTDNLAVALGSGLTDFYSMLAESAIVYGTGAKAFQSLAYIAEQTSLAAFRFLAAWTAFNLNDLERCIAECELVDEPFAPIQTLLGQALLEAGQVAEAIDTLKIAVELDGSDPLPLVQLVKAYLVTGIQIEAMRYIDKCRKLLGSNIEIECLAAMAIMSGENRSADFMENTLSRIAAYFENNSDDIATFSIALNLAADLNRIDWASKFISIWEIPSSTNPFQLAGKVSELLKKIGELQWHELSRQIIDKTLVINSPRTGQAVMQ